MCVALMIQCKTDGDGAVTEVSNRVDGLEASIAELLSRPAEVAATLEKAS